MANNDTPRVGLGVIIVNSDGKILVLKRIGKRAPEYAIPGGNLELGETFEAGAIREVKEETNLDIHNPIVMAVSNNLESVRVDSIHYISVFLLATEYSGELKNMEPTKCGGYEWVDPKNLPQPHFNPSRLGVECYLKKSFYEGMK